MCLYLGATTFAGLMKLSQLLYRKITQAGIIPSIFVPLAPSSRNSILNLVLKLNHFFEKKLKLLKRFLVYIYNEKAFNPF